MSLSAGSRLGAYEILSPLGRGGMGQVYRARHEKLGREVAIKVLPDDVATDRERLVRFEREARLASSLNHPNIVTIHDIAEHEGRTFIAMELVDGKTIRQLANGPLPLDEAMRIASQIADGLARAHSAGIVHRDLKPENIMVTNDGLVKILDFGLARPLVMAGDGGSQTPTYTRATAEGVAVGTPRYMSPEQISGGPVDGRSDQFSLGMVLYEMLTGRPAFDGPSLPSIISAIVRDTPPPLRQLRPDAPAGLVRVIDRCLAKSADDRYPSTAEVYRQLRDLEQRRLHGAAMPLRRRTVAIALAVIGLFAIAAAVMWFRGAGRRWAGNEAPRQIATHIEAGRLYEAYRLVLRAKQHRPDDPELQKMYDRITLPMQVVTEPPGAVVSVKGYSTPNAPWVRLGVTPLEIRAPYALMRWRIQKEGFEPFEGAPFSGLSMRALSTGLTLDPAGSAPPGMVRVPSGAFRGGPHRLDLPEGMMALPIETYWLDRFEVTNRQFKEFVDAGGYADEVLQPFRDATGRPGPATWSLGTYAEGTGDLPVGGVSWHEAAAYCRAAGKTLPTIYHWFSAVGQEQLSDILRLSNFDGEAPAPVGKYQGVAGFGAYDMAGNVREWCSNPTGAGERYILGGAWNDPPYMFRHIVARPPEDRLPVNGFRCAMYPAPIGQLLLDPVEPSHEIAKPPPITEEIFDAYAGMYAYQRSDLQAEVEHVDETSAHWRKEVVSFKAAYGDETMRALLFIPRNAAPPYQTVVWFPGDDVFIFRSSDTLASSYLFDFIPRSGRVLVYPIYRGMYERWLPVSFQPIEWRDRVMAWSKDIGRTLDYLETRGDIDSDRIAYYGFSSGAIYGPVFSAVEPRIRASILLGGGVVPRAMRPEMDLAHFAPRSRVPTLMINGFDDFIMPYDSSQKPLFELLGAAPDDKRHARLEGGHIPTRRQDMIREVLDWLDRSLGPVQTGRPAVAAK